MMQSEDLQANLSQPASQNAVLQKVLAEQQSLLSSFPSIPTILQSLIGEAPQAPEKVDLNRVVDLIGRDKSMVKSAALRKAWILWSFGRIPWDVRSSAENSQELSGLKIPKRLISGDYCTIWDISSIWFCFRSKKRQRSIARCRRANLLARGIQTARFLALPEW